jgi:phospholipase C
MPSWLSEIETIVVVMMENRSFDHLLGYLSLAGRTDIDGLKKNPDGSWPDNYGNPWKGRPRWPYELNTAIVKDDPGHARQSVRRQLNQQPDGICRMDGFVEDFLGDARGHAEDSDEDKIPTMGYYTAEWVPVFDYFAKHYTVCDKWFSCLPTETQPNRLMSLAGHTLFDYNMKLLQEPDDLIFRWLDDRKVRWGYFKGGYFSVLSMMTTSYQAESLEILPHALSQSKFPQVIWIDPELTFSDWLPPGTDDHPPASILDGQLFLGGLYKTLRQSPRWNRTLLIVTYDEHGGFFDHVPPLELLTPQPAGGSYTGGTFTLSGVRVPAFLISPYVTPGKPFHQPVDNTCILKLLGDRFGRKSDQYPYNEYVNGQNRANLGSLADALSAPTAPPPIHLIDQIVGKASMEMVTFALTGESFTTRSFPALKEKARRRPRRRTPSQQITQELTRAVRAQFSLEMRRAIADRTGLTEGEFSKVLQTYTMAGEKAVSKRLTAVTRTKQKRKPKSRK